MTIVIPISVYDTVCVFLGLNVKKNCPGLKYKKYLEIKIHKHLSAEINLFYANWLQKILI